MGMLAFAHQQVWEIAVATGLMGVGFGFAYSAMSALVVAAVPASQTGVATGMNANIRTIGGSIGAAAMASIVTSHLAKSGLPLESGYTTGFAVMTVALLLATGAGLLIPATRGRRAACEVPRAEVGAAEVRGAASDQISASADTVVTGE